ncbi:glutamate--tRNA ligase [uncultured Megasphaera sp.]|uniref:glutamate--tRNA ligase n=1 Tax=uncultured Megasphaera sp. TaxID=165188 RepID=UPI002657E8FC|nr:glutamate--tRNA ligase [uncultured Megasphaera sp.]
MSQEVRVRFAPSPTGPFHIGGARSALFNYLEAKHTGGKFIVRIEDTDRKRSTAESEENIKEALKWLGITWDEGIDVGGNDGPYRQTERLEIYRKYTEKLLAEGKAYYCFCTPEELEAEKEAQMQKGETPVYSGKCRNLPKETVEQYLKEGRPYVIRIATPKDETIEIDDLVRGHVTFDSNKVGDFVIVKSDGIPVYNYCVVIDDALMHITHVIRAEEHLSNTPRQIVLYHALGFDVPKFAHVSLILGADKKKMSKRHGATSVQQYRDLGYLPDALVNFLALLGWTPEGDQEIFTRDELIQQFSLDRVAKNPAVFDIEKLNWINFHYMKQLDADQLFALCLPHLQKAGYAPEELDETKKQWLKDMVWAMREHVQYGAQITDAVKLFFTDDYAPENEETAAVLKEETAPAVLTMFCQELQALDDVTADTVQPLFKKIQKGLKVKGKFVYMPIRVALTGVMHGPDLNVIVALMGRDKVVSRLQASGLLQA